MVANKNCLIHILETLFSVSCILTVGSCDEKQNLFAARSEDEVSPTTINHHDQTSVFTTTNVPVEMLNSSAITPATESVNVTITTTSKPVNRTKQVCYEHVGCFSNAPPFDNADLVLPKSPKTIGKVLTISLIAATMFTFFDQSKPRSTCTSLESDDDLH